MNFTPGSSGVSNPRRFRLEQAEKFFPVRESMSKHSTPKVATGCYVITLCSAFGKTSLLLL